jgi:type III secretion system needle length determinant
MPSNVPDRPISPTAGTPREAEATAGKDTATHAPSRDDQTRFNRLLGGNGKAKTDSEPKDRAADRSSIEDASQLFRRRAEQTQDGDAEQPQDGEAKQAPDGEAKEKRPDNNAPVIVKPARPDEDADLASDPAAKARNANDATPARDEKSVQPDEDATRAMTADMILRNFASPIPTVEQTPPPAEPRAAALNDAVREIADRILVGQSSTTGQQEVRILLKSEVLGGTEVRVSEHAGAVEITFVAGTKDAEAFLQDRGAGMQEQLSQRLDREVRVNLVPADAPMGDRRQSAGDAPDGRSRNRRSVRDEQEN